MTLHCPNCGSPFATPHNDGDPCRSCKQVSPKPAADIPDCTCVGLGFLILGVGPFEPIQANPACPEHGAEFMQRLLLSS